MVFTIEEVLEKSKEAAGGVSFEEALKRTSNFKINVNSQSFNVI